MAHNGGASPAPASPPWLAQTDFDMKKRLAWMMLLQANWGGAAFVPYAQLNQPQ